MYSAYLTALQLDRWLVERGVELKESCWTLVRSGCSDQTVFDYQLVIDQVPWRGEARVVLSFIQRSKLQLACYCVSDSPTQLSSDDEPLAIGVVLEAVIRYPRRLQRPSRSLTPHVNQPQYGVKVEHPSLENLDAAWEALISVAPLADRALEALCVGFEQEMERLAPFA
jgi:hypothetical protein